MKSVKDCDQTTVFSNRTRTYSFAAVESLDTISICVPTPLRKTRDPDLSYIMVAVEAVHNHLRPGKLIVLESTTYPGTTREVVLPNWRSRVLRPAETSGHR